MKTLILLLLTSSMLMGCDSMSQTWNDYYYQGTNVGYQRCVERNTGIALSEETVRFQCLSKHEKSFIHSDTSYVEEITGYYSIPHQPDEPTTFTASIKNSSRDRIITSLVISIKHKEDIDGSGKPRSETLYAPSIWIEPKQTKDVKFFDLKSKPDPHKDQKGLLEWSVSSAGLLKIVLL